MILLDANILLYAYNADLPEHAIVSSWLERIVSSSEVVALPLPVAWAFLRISTNQRLWSHPKTSAEAFTILKTLLGLPGVILLAPGDRHLGILETVAANYKAVGPLMSDAVLAAMAVENGATLASTDRDFSRFENLHWVNPLEEPAS